MDPQDRGMRGQPVNLHGVGPLSGLPLGLPGVPNPGPESSSCPQDVSKKLPRRAKTAQVRSKTPQEVSKMPQDTPQTVQEASKIRFLGEFWSQNASKLTP